MHIRLVLYTTPLLALFASTASAQAGQSVRLPWDLPAAQASAQLERSGFRRGAADGSAYVAAPGGGFRRVAGDSSVSTYLRDSGGVAESIFMRARAGRPAQLFYSVVGDSAAVHAKLAAAAADAAGRLGTGAVERGLPTWHPADGQRLTVPSRPTRLPDNRFQFVVLFQRARADQ